VDLKDLGKETLTITVVLVIVAVIALLVGGDRGFLRDLATEWVWWVGVLALIAIVFGGWHVLRRRR
jgi:pheromone shutdown protein TraB